MSTMCWDGCLVASRIPVLIRCVRRPAPPIPGTSIRLETEEDIAKWIAQRRARWPTAARVEEKVSLLFTT